MNAIAAWFSALDRVRRTEGYVLDCMEFGPRESAYRVIHSMPGARLRRYALGERTGRSLLIVPAPIKRPYIWDLRPERSVVRRAAERGFNVHLVEWAESDGWAAANGLQHYVADILNACVEAVTESSEASSLVLVGHSLGGTLAAAYGAYRPERIAGLVLIETPLHFAEASGAFRGMLDTGIPAKTVLHPANRASGCLID